MGKKHGIAVGNNRIVESEYTSLPTHELSFYPENPRIGSIIETGKLSNDKIHELMREKQGEAVKELFRRIQKDGQINEPVTVYHNIVLEGNTRLWAARELLGRAKTKEEKEKWNIMPCRVITEELKKEEIDYILCDYHIKKKRDWDPYMQGSYFTKMHEEDGLTHQVIATMTETSQPMVGMYIGAYKTMKRVNADKRDWSHYLELYKQPEAKKEIVNNTVRLKTFANKIKTGKIREAQDVRKLVTVLKDPSAKKAFFEKPDVDLVRAELMAIRMHPEEGDPFLKELEEMRADLAVMPLGRIESFERDPKKIEIITKFFYEYKKFMKRIGLNVKS